MRRIALRIGVVSLVLGCGGGSDGGGADDSTGGSDDPNVPPAAESALLDWLDEGFYTAWTSETEIHASTGPHFGGVLTYFNPNLEQSLTGGAATHPADVAAVKELYRDGDAVLGWAVGIKTQADSANGDGWYWLEIIDGNVLVAGEGVSVCSNCHAGGQDFVLSPLP